MHKKILATFTELRKQNPNEITRLQCNQTQAVYVVTRVGRLFNVYCNGWKFAERANIAWALNALQQDAELAVREIGCESYAMEVR